MSDIKSLDDLKAAVGTLSEDDVIALNALLDPTATQ